MNNFDELPFEQNDSFNSENNFEQIPTTETIPTMMDDNNIIVLDERIKDIKPEEKSAEPT